MNLSEALSLRAVHYFIAVYESQSFSEVARREGVSASTVSRIVQQMEDALGQQLFYRNTRAVVPSEAGHLLIDYARRVRDELAAAQRRLAEKNQQPAGLLRINAPQFFGQHHLARWLPALTARYPLLQVELTLTDDFIDPHREGCDLIFRIGALPDSRLHARIVATQRYHLAASPAYLRQCGALRRPADLVSHRCLVYRGSASGANKWYFRQGATAWQHQPVSAVFTSNSAESLLRAAVGGMGLVLFPDWLLGDSLHSGALQSVLTAYQAAVAMTPQQVAMLWPATRHLSLNVRATIDYFTEVFAEPPYWQATE
ncbi:LysR family transcriptional regulator [Pantoea sp. 1.19]|uniref:LysR family transcriptional regulator n=1 Tax=Pantoea sp. 1.19 TaxID=1925589 RepID=UPI000948F550|nr:LysR family transcriptional regulator [Pantoea sp. 1.19]